VGDERDVPINHADRNSTMIEQTMPQLIEKSHYYPLLNAQEYDELIAQKIPFDLVLLGMGEDGHTAGIFPDKTYTYLNYLQITDDAPKPPSRRMSLRIEALNSSRQIWVFVTGESKKNALNQWFNGKNLPIAQIKALENLILFCDKTALPN
jgi:6-phosphogluconolactonase